ncbi:MAG: tetratricopeptide repeat protein, partial [Deltaproteobacteria bacterium]|nr:tetratricopeptide repeat protein [Deltaproteobacteria bacterium]
MSKRLGSLGWISLGCCCFFFFFSCTKKYPEQQFLQAERLHSEHRYQEEAELYELMLQHTPQGPEGPRVAFRMAEIYERFLGDKAKGLEVYASIADKWRGSPEAFAALERRAGIYEENEEYPLAVAEYEKLLDRGKSPHDKILYRVASCHLKMKEFHRARTSFFK